MNDVQMPLSSSCVTPYVGVVILNWNGLEDLLECIPTVINSSYKNISIIVVDNGSSDDTLIEIPKRFPAVTMIATGINLGWAGGNNIGIKHAIGIGCEYVFLLNNDTTISSNCIECLIEAATNTGPSLIHPSIYYYDEPSVAQLDPLQDKPSADRSKVVQINYAYGAAILIDSILFNQIGLIDDRFFLQLEETDFFYRAKVFGINSYVLPKASVLHKESRSFGGKVAPIKSYYIVRNTLLLIYKHTAALGGWKVGLHKLLWTIMAMINRERGGIDRTFFSNLIWLFSNNFTAKAIRYGVYDFVFKNFGAMSRKRSDAINYNK